MLNSKHKSNLLAEISSVFSMTLLLTLFGLFIYFRWTANKKSLEIKEQLSLDILFHENVDSQMAIMMEKHLKSMDEMVKQATFVSKENAKKIMGKIAKVSEKGTGQINVSGHTDNVPLIFGGQYRDNWDLAAARASSVVQSISKSGDIPLDRLMAISYGESKPLASNNDATGRSKNRRIEIEIKY